MYIFKRYGVINGSIIRPVYIPAGGIIFLQVFNGMVPTAKLCCYGVSIVQDFVWTTDEGPFPVFKIVWPCQPTHLRGAIYPVIFLFILISFVYSKYMQTGCIPASSSSRLVANKSHKFNRTFLINFEFSCIMYVQSNIFRWICYWIK